MTHGEMLLKALRIWMPLIFNAQARLMAFHICFFQKVRSEPGATDERSLTYQKWRPTQALPQTPKPPGLLRHLASGCRRISTEESQDFSLPGVVNTRFWQVLTLVDAIVREALKGSSHFEMPLCSVVAINEWMGIILVTVSFISLFGCTFNATHVGIKGQAKAPLTVSLPTDCSMLVRCSRQLTIID